MKGSMITPQRRRFKLDKLVRDRMPEHVRHHPNVVLKYHVLEHDVYIQCLRDKLLEESTEVIEASSVDDLKHELADLLEVIHAMIQSNHLTYHDVEAIRLEKKIMKGGFEERIYGTWIEADQHDPGIKHFTDRPEKYPEIPLDQALPDEA